MILRLLLIAFVLAALCRWALGRWPWEYLAGSTSRSPSLQQARTLLGVPAGASREEVIAAHRRKVALIHPDRGGDTAAMQEANAARDLLLSVMPSGGGDGGHGGGPQ